MEAHPFVCPASRCTYGSTGHITKAYVSDSNQFKIYIESEVRIFWVYGDFSATCRYRALLTDWLCYLRSLRKILYIFFVKIIISVFVASSFSSSSGKFLCRSLIYYLFQSRSNCRNM